MKSENCSLCFYSEESELNEILQKYSTKIRYKCIHENSPYYKETVSDEDSCRLFMDEKEYFFMKDRRTQIENLQDKIKGKRK